MSPDDDAAVEVAGRLAREAGSLLWRIRARGSVRTELKHGNEVVTEADLRSEELIRQAIETEFPSHRVVSEESWDGWQEDIFAGPVWIVDPLDGTVNFVHHHSFASVSVAFAVDGVLTIAPHHLP